MDITIRNLQKKIPLKPRKIKEAVLKTLELEGSRKAGELNILFCTDAQIKKVNSRYLGEDSATDVISFNLSVSPKKLAGDMVISVEQAVANAKIFNTNPRYELYLYVVHGMLHLLGYDDKSGLERKTMDAKAERILECLSIRPKQ